MFANLKEDDNITEDIYTEEGYSSVYATWIDTMCIENAICY